MRPPQTHNAGLLPTGGSPLHFQFYKTQDTPAQSDHRVLKWPSSFLFPRLAGAVHWLDIYPGARYPNTTCSCFCFAFALMFAFCFLRSSLPIPRRVVFLRKGMRPVQTLRTPKHRRLRCKRSVRKEEIPICFDFSVRGPWENGRLFFAVDFSLLLSVTWWFGGV